MVSKTIIEAGGGLVCTPDGRFLMIFRRGFWDLPKGKREIGESIEQCALREVMEECGIESLRLGEQICVTSHDYILDGIEATKLITWFFMYVDRAVDLVPQTSEDISAAVWVSRQDVAAKLMQSFSTIADVFKNALER